MGTEESNSSLAVIDACPSPSMAASLSKFNTAALRRDFERLSVDDLTALASFPVEPHELIGRVVAVTHCLLLTLSHDHSALELRAPPWSVLRLQILEDTQKIWRKLRKRARQLETGVKTLSPVQIRFGCKELEPLICPLNSQSGRKLEWEIDRLAQVSTIAASLGAWIGLCLYWSIMPSLSTTLRCDILDIAANAAQNDNASAQSLHAKIPARDKSPQKRELKQTANTISSVMGATTTSKLEPLVVPNQRFRSSRCFGVKVGGRFLLLHTRFPVSLNYQPDVKSFETSGEWSVYCLDTNRIGREPSLKQTFSSSVSPLNASWWKSPRVIESLKTPRAPRLCCMISLAQQSLLLQLGFHERLFERPQDIPNVKLLRAVSSVFTLKLGILMVNFKQQCSILGIGNALITMETTVAELRSHLTPLVSSRLFNVADKGDTFHFMYRGSLLPQSQERPLAAVTLLPFALFIVAERYHMNESRTGSRRSQLWRHHCEIAQALVNSGIPDHIPQAGSVPHLGSQPPEIQVYSMRQPLISTVADHTLMSKALFSTEVLVEVLTHWRAFVYFQQLQSSSILFQRSPQIQCPHMKPQQNPPQDDHAQIRIKDVSYGPHPQPLPRKVRVALFTLHLAFHYPSQTSLSFQKFNSKKEWLLPVYATIDVVSFNTGLLKTPFRQKVQRIISSPCRLVVGEDQNVIHLTRVNAERMERDQYGIHLAAFDVTFMRDESCSLESLLRLRGSYIWLILPRKSYSNPETLTLPTEWMIDLYRFVQHPTYDFQSPDCPQVNHFRVPMSWRIAECTVEAEFWSKDVDWRSSMSSTDLYNTVLRQIYDALCRSHPPAFGVDSVKFSKLLYEAKIQPTLLAIGDAAFLFASNLTPGFTYEMDFDGFVRALEWLAQQFYSEKRKSKSGPSKILPGIQHEMMKWQLSRRGENNMRDHLSTPLRRFCYETLVHLPSLSSTWNNIMNSWRLAHKEQCLREYVLKYCAATRRLRFSLYRAKPTPSENTGDHCETSTTKAQLQQDTLCQAYELEVVDSTRSWGLVFYVSQQQIDQFVVEETERLTLQLDRGLAFLDVGAKCEIPSALSSRVVHIKLPRGRKQICTPVVRDSVVNPVLNANILLLALARRLTVVKNTERNALNLRCYTDPINTSLGKFIVYTPATSARLRYDLAASFLLSVLQFSRFESMSLRIMEEEGDATEAEADHLKLRAAFNEAQGQIHHQIHHIVNGAHKISALQCILNYVLEYGVRTPTYSMMPHVVAERERRLKERKMAELNAILTRERELIVKVQARFRQHLARKTRLQLALRQSGDRTVLGEQKPFSLFNEDVPLPKDEWFSAPSAAALYSGSCFFNPRRGIYSRYNNILAAAIIQRWFRDKMWNGINTWKLREIAIALTYHSNVQKPSSMADPRQLENIKRRALQVHVLQHQVQTQSMHDSALTLPPDHPFSAHSFADTSIKQLTLSTRLL
ncbi:unnamed protein product [Phytophthora fragariaefolia]|uniref:Unnamed protein product n=1 Tax=Phytophthora fragariaefolia TaxID=1490495 RepID=A0A9W6WVB9_9STRA|nr:unnamed protein product [Phytophthora fragariaefolia]